MHLAQQRQFTMTFLTFLLAGAAWFDQDAHLAWVCQPRLPSRHPKSNAIHCELSTTWIFIAIDSIRRCIFAVLHWD
eukprot:3039289-Rhodomonas_salina.1